MKNGIVKIWVCQNCQKEYIDRQVMCSKCGKFEFEVKYGGVITGAEELTKLVETYRQDSIKDAVNMVKTSIREEKKDTSAKLEKPAEEAKPDSNKRTRM